MHITTPYGTGPDTLPNPERPIPVPPEPEPMPPMPPPSVPHPPDPMPPPPGDPGIDPRPRPDLV